MMIGLVVEDGEGSIQLLGEDKTHHLVRKCHLRERYLVVGSRVYIGRKTIGAANDKH